MLVPCSSPLVGVVKIVEVAKATKVLVFRLECVPSSVLLQVLLTLLEPASSSVLSSTRSSCPQTEQTVTESRVMAVSLHPAVAVAVNTETQSSEPILVVSPDAPSDDNEFQVRTRELLLGSGDTACPLADLACADIAAATAAVTAAEDDDDAETDSRPGSLSSVRARTSASWQQAAGAANGGQAERMAFWVTQRSLTSVHVRRIAQAHGAGG